MDSANPGISASLNEWLDWLLALHAQEIDLGLDRISKVAHKLGVLKNTPYIISVAGTNGKGSSVAMLCSIYQAAGYKVGSYTSPHILSFNERIQVNQTPVSDETIVAAFSSIEAARGDVKLTYFEFATLAAWVIFQQEQLDVWVLEVGLGGRLDAVNAADADIALITAVDVDHSDWLGNDRELIALEKAGIMRSGKPAVCSDADIPRKLLSYAEDQDVDLICLDDAFQYMPKACESVSPDYDCTPAWQFLVSPELSANKSLENLDNLPYPALQGSFQLQNAAGVIAVVQRSDGHLSVDKASIGQGLLQVKHPGRLQTLVYGNESWLVDVAHNPQSAEVLADYLTQKSFKGDAVFSVLEDKDYSKMIRQICPFIDHWYVADLNVPRAAGMSQLKQTMIDSGVDEGSIIVCCDIHSATNQAYENNLAKLESNILCWGSFYTVSQCMETLNNLSDR